MTEPRLGRSAEPGWADPGPRGSDLVVDLKDLDPAIRVLVLQDGTFTTALEALLLKELAVLVVAQGLAQSDSKHAALLDVMPTTELLLRRGQIWTTATHEVVAQTWAGILPDRFPPGFDYHLHASPRGIGEALERMQLCARRELLGVAWVPETNELSRSYKLLVSDLPACLIEERLDLDAAPIRSVVARPRP